MRSAVAQPFQLAGTPQAGSDRGEGGGHGRRLPALTVPQQVKVPGQLARSVHDARHLADDRHHGAVVMQGTQQRQRV
jgi:hypothetical protein